MSMRTEFIVPLPKMIGIKIKIAICRSFYKMTMYYEVHWQIVEDVDLHFITLVLREMISFLYRFKL